MEKGVSAKGAKRDAFAWWLVLPVLPLILYALLPAYREYRATEEQRDAMKQHNARLVALNEGLSKELHAARTDPFYVEKVAREGLGYRKPGEIAFRPKRGGTMLARSVGQGEGVPRKLARRAKEHKGLLGAGLLVIAATWGIHLISTGDGGRK